MTKPELGTKRLCAECGVRYYDLNTTPITCPKCGAAFQIVETTTRTRSTPRPVPPKAEPASPASPDTLIEELDEDEADVSEIVGENSEHQEDT